MQEQNNWISVKDALPKAGQQVFLIDAETGYAYVGWMNKPLEWWFYNINQEEDHPEKTITHWKPIIKPEKEKAMQEQDLKEYYRTVFTLKTGIRIEICTEEEIPNFDWDIKTETWIYSFEGFIVTPLIVKKTIRIELEEIAAIEITKEPYITWKDTELDDNSHGCYKLGSRINNSIGNEE